MTASRQWQLIRSWLRRTYNKEVHEFFKDIPADLDLDFDINTGRSATKAVCLIGANDSQGIAEIKRGIFRDLKERAGIYSQPMHPFLALPDVTVEGYPQAQLWFYERQRTAKQYNRRPLYVRIGFRIYDNNFTPSNAETLARKIRDTFAKPILHFTTGKLKLTYRDTRKGQLFILPVPTVAEGKDVLEKVFLLLNQTPNWDRLTTSDPEGDFPKAGKNYQVYGKTIKQHTNRSGTEVYFRYAIAKVPPLQHDIPLVDTSQTYLNAIFHEANPYLVKENLPRRPKADNLPLLNLLKQQT
jgi:hypothetical protein